MDSSNNSTARVLIGLALILLGGMFLAGQIFGFTFNINFGALAWPFFVLIPGVLLFLFALAMESEAGAALAAIGSVTTTTGLLLFYQNLTSHWESWAYAWALVGPAAVGLGFILYGILKNRPALTRTGTNLVMIGAGIFLMGAVFFELVLGISGFRILALNGLGGLCWPVLLIGIGLVVLVLNLLPRRNVRRDQ